MRPKASLLNLVPRLGMLRHRIALSLLTLLNCCSRQISSLYCICLPLGKQDFSNAENESKSAFFTMLHALCSQAVCRQAFTCLNTCSALAEMKERLVFCFMVADTSILQGLEDVIGVSIVHPTWQRTRPDDPEDLHNGWTFAKPGDPPFKSPTGAVPPERFFRFAHLSSCYSEGASLSTFSVGEAIRQSDAQCRIW